MSLRERICRLIDVKSMVTLALVGVLCVMTAMGRETSELFNSSVMLVLGFFFGKNLKPTDIAGTDEKSDEKTDEKTDD